MLKKIALFAICSVLLLCTVGCAPTITVVHQDPTNKQAQLRIDNKSAGTIEFGQQRSKTVSRGLHYVEAIPEGEESSPWTEDGKGLSIWVDKGAVLTLLPPGKKESNRKISRLRESDRAPVKKDDDLGGSSESQDPYSEASEIP